MRDRVAACGQRGPGALGVLAISTPIAQPAATIPQLTDATASSGIRFRHTNGAFGKKYLPETMGSGAAFLDVDNDGWPDVFLVNSKNWPGPAGRPHHLRALPQQPRRHLHRRHARRRDWRSSSTGMGVTAADFDNDGRADLYITALGPNRLFRNNGGGRFADVTAPPASATRDFPRAPCGSTTTATAGSICSSPTTSTGRSRRTSSARSTERRSPTARRSPTRAEPDALPQQGRRHVRERHAEGGPVYDPAAKALGVALLDYDNDGWLDLFVANDTQPNRLYRNKGKGTFTDVGMTAGVAFNEAGVARAGMGVDAADYDGSGRPSLIIGNFSNEMMALYSNEGNGPVHRRGADLDDRPGVAAHADVRLLLLRLRPRRPARHLRRQRPRGRRHQQGPA